ncbi:MAG: DNA polymerase III subunit beta [Bacillota bacterium]
MQIERKVFHSALRIVEAATAKRENVPVLNGVLLDARNPGNLVVAATDLKLGIRATLHAEGDGGWARVVDARLLVGLTGKLPAETVTLEPTDKQIRVISAGARFNLASMDAEDFPELPSPEARATVRLTAGILGGVLGRVAFAAAESDKRPVLSGVYVEVGPSALTLAATDSSRLATETIPLDGPTGVADGSSVSAIVPRRSVEEAARILGAISPGAEVVMDVGERLIAVQAGAYTLTTRLIEGMFPPFRQVLLSDPAHRVGFERRTLLDAVSRLSLLSRRGPAVVMFEPADEPGRVVLRAIEADVGEGVETLRTVGAPWPEGLRPAYQARFLEEFLRAVESETVEYAVSDPARQSQWSVAGSDYRYVVMPVRLDTGAVARAA